MMTATAANTGTEQRVGRSHDHPAQVVLLNDNVNTFVYVIASLKKIFGHRLRLAQKIAWEAHNRGRAIAEVEPRESAMKHCAALKECGFQATVESL